MGKFGCLLLSPCRKYKQKARQYMPGNSHGKPKQSEIKQYPLLTRLSLAKIQKKLIHRSLEHSKQKR